MRTILILAWTIILTMFPCFTNAQAVKKNMQTNQSIEEIKKHIADLDTEYQRAVKTNDAATMNRILADDFILVTGRGKVFTKAALLRETRSGKHDV